jgi:hypothetical protein
VDLKKGRSLKDATFQVPHLKMRKTVNAWMASAFPIHAQATIIATRESFLPASITSVTSPGSLLARNSEELTFENYCNLCFCNDFSFFFGKILLSIHDYRIRDVCSGRIESTLINFRFNNNILV